MALVNGGFLHYMDTKKFLRNLPLRNHWPNFEIISQESGFDISEHPDCQIRALIATGKLPSPFVSPPVKVKFSVCYRQFRVFITDTGSFWSLRSDRQMDIKLFTEFLTKKPVIHQKTWLL